MVALYTYGAGTGHGLRVAVFSQYCSFCVKLGQRNHASKLMRIKVIRKGVEEVIGKGQGLCFSVLEGLNIGAVPKE